MVKVGKGAPLFLGLPRSFSGIKRLVWVLKNHQNRGGAAKKGKGPAPKRGARTGGRLAEPASTAGGRRTRSQPALVDLPQSPPAPVSDPIPTIDQAPHAEHGTAMAIPAPQVFNQGQSSLPDGHQAWWPVGYGPGPSFSQQHPAYGNFTYPMQWGYVGTGPFHLAPLPALQAPPNRSTPGLPPESYGHPAALTQISGVPSVPH